MKVFLVNSDLDYNLPNEKSNIKIQKEKGFKSIVIKNPKNSKIIYSLYDLRLSVKQEVKALRLFSYEEKAVDIEHEETIGSLCISPAQIIIDPLDFLELNKINFKELNSTNILEGKYMILLPAGKLLLHFENEVSEIELNLYIKEERL